jgi:hypothetical protein
LLARDSVALRNGQQRAWRAARIALGVAPGLARPK